MKRKEKIIYPFGIYFCKNKCMTLIIWYPDTKKFPELNTCPNFIECPICNSKVELTEEFYIKDIWKELVPLFSYASVSPKFQLKKRLIMLDNEHIHLGWLGMNPKEIN
ncbi:MAG: hypothetical protein EAX96_01350 [Candidatus Lokiarchaeota archaeon]|nr:hypothetical protein [Candidatus Lokiarchaeota archaeon]